MLPVNEFTEIFRRRVESTGEILLSQAAFIHDLFDVISRMERDAAFVLYVVTHNYCSRFRRKDDFQREFALSFNYLNR